MTRTLVRSVCASVVLVLAALRPVHAQSELEQRATPELRADVIRIGNRYGVQAGGGVELPMGYYARLGLIGAAGADVERRRQHASARLDVVGRFLFDPFRQQRWGLSAGGGVSLRARAGDRVRPYLMSVIDLEGPRSARGVVPALQLGIGGGIRLGIALRWGQASSR